MANVVAVIIVTSISFVLVKVTIATMFTADFDVTIVETRHAIMIATVAIALVDMVAVLLVSPTIIAHAAITYCAYLSTGTSCLSMLVRFVFINLVHDGGMGSATPLRKASHAARCKMH